VSVRSVLDHRLSPILAMTGVVIALPLFFPSPYYYRVAALVFVFALAALGLNLLMGFAGQVSLGHAGFMGIGAYAVAVGPAHLGGPSWMFLVLGAGLAALVAFIVGRPILRLKGHYLAVATLGFGLLLAIVFTNEARLTGGPDGGVHVTDVTNGFRAYRLSLFDDPRIRIDQDWLEHYELEYYLNWKAITLDYRVLEVGVSKTYPASGGYSKIRRVLDWWSIVKPTLLLWLRLRS